MTIDPFSFGPVAKVAYGPGRAARLGKDLAGLVAAGAPVLLVADPGVVRAGIADTVERAVVEAGFKAAVYSDIRSDPLAAQVDGAAEAARQHDAAAVVALGGGSTLDTAKFAAAIAGDDKPAEHYALAVNPLPRQGLAKICLPTTAGTGSETTRVSVFTNGRDEKVWAWGEQIRPDLAVLDPKLTAGLPAGLTAATGVDALVHAIEAATIRRANPMNDAVCLQAIRLVVRHLQRAVEVPDDLEARGGMQIAAALAGIAIDNSGTGIAHAMGHALGAIGHVHHGRAVGLCLRAALDWNVEAAPDRHALVAEAMGVPAHGRGAAEVAAELPAAYEAFLRSVGLPIALAPDGLTTKDAPRLAEVTMAPENKAMRDANIREIGAEDALRIAGKVLAAA